MRDPKRFDPRRLDVSAFAKAGESIEGRWPLQDFRRLADLVLPDPSVQVHWTAEGAWRPRAGDAPRLQLTLHADVAVQMTCQRCLEPAVLPLQIRRRLRFVSDEQLAERLDESSDDEDVLALPARVDLRDLLEDELILSLPIVPRHEHCPNPLPMQAVDDAEEPVADDVPGDPADGRPEHPFAALAALKRSGKAN